MDNLLSIVRCLDCYRSVLHEVSPHLWKCTNCGLEFTVVSGRPVLLHRDNEVFSSNDYTDSASIPKKRSYRRWIPDISVNLSQGRLIEAYLIL